MVEEYTLDKERGCGAASFRVVGTLVLQGGPLPIPDISLVVAVPVGLAASKCYQDARYGEKAGEFNALDLEI